MKKKIVMALMATVIATSTLGTGMTVHAAEATDAAATTTEVGAKKTIAKQNLKKDVIAKVFDAKYYATAYPDVVAAIGADANVLLAHYMNFGIYEGRDASETFNASVYAIANPDLLAAYGENFEGLVEHFINFGINEKRVATPAAFAALDSKTASTVVSQSASYLSNKGSDISSYSIIPSSNYVEYGSGVGTDNYINPLKHKFASFEEAYAFMTRNWTNPSAEDLEIAKQEAWANQGYAYDTHTGQLQKYGTTVYEDYVDEWGGRKGQRLSESGFGWDVYNISSEGLDAKMAAEGRVKTYTSDGNVVYELSSDSSSSSGSSDSNSSSSSSDSGSSSGSSAGDYSAEGFSWDDELKYCVR